MKPGFKTTEFALAVLVGLGSFIASVADYLPPRYAAMASAVVVGLYGISRGLAKVPTPIVPPAPPTTVAPPSPPTP
jgi:hypothetical protein